MKNEKRFEIGGMINLACEQDLDGLPYEVVDSCEQCEFRMTADAGGAIGAQIGNRGAFAYCELGYWKEET